MSDELRTSQLAAAAEVNTQTLRYYERRGLLPKPQRTLGGHRLYPAETVTLLKVIKAAQRLGFTLNEITDLITTATHRQSRTDRGLQNRVRDRLIEVEAKIADLQIIAETLRQAREVGCEDLLACVHSPRCPLPFNELATQTV